MTSDQRVFTRIPFVRPLRWFDGRGNEGIGAVCDVGRGGVRIESSAYMRPGPMITVAFDGLEYEGEPVQLRAVVSWTKPDKNRSTFSSGLSWVHGERLTLPRINELYYSAIQAHVGTAASN